MNAPTPEIPPSQMGLERVIFFSDAVFAIVITLLVLPLAADVDLPVEPASWAATTTVSSG